MEWSCNQWTHNPILIIFASPTAAHMVNTCTSVNFSRTLKPDDNIYKIRLYWSKKKHSNFFLRLNLFWTGLLVLVTQLYAAGSSKLFSWLSWGLIWSLLSSVWMCNVHPHQGTQWNLGLGTQWKNTLMLGRIVEMIVAMHVIGNCKTALRQVSHYLSEFKFYVVSVASPVPQF